MKLQTPVTDTPCRTGISYKDKIMMLGSCFTDNIGRQLADLGFDVCINPFGTLYNPASIYNSIKRLTGRQEFTSADCTEIGAGSRKICSFSHHTSFARDTEEEFLENANHVLEKAADFYRDCNKVIITLGTSWCFRHLEKGEIVSNCLKHTAGEFQRERLSAGEIADILGNIISTKPEDGAEKDFIFTVSPIRHFKDGAHGNQISKAGLLLGIEDILYQPHTDYFPSFEIMMDELRDYRFYAEDMCHPTKQATDYIRERFLNWALPENETETLENNIRRLRQSAHATLSESIPQTLRTGDRS